MLQSFPYWKADNRCHRGHSQSSLFVGVDIEVLALTRSLIGDGLGRQVDFDFCFRIGKIESKSSARKGSLTTTGRTKLFSSLFLWISAKNWTQLHETHNRQSPKQHVRDWNPSRSFSPPPVSVRRRSDHSRQTILFYFPACRTASRGTNFHQTLFVGCFQETSRNDLVRIHIL